MATKRLQGFLRDPLSEFAQHDLWRFTHLTTTGEVVKGSQSIRRIGADGSYDFLIRFGRVLIESKDRLSQRWVIHGEYTINAQTTATTIPALLLATTPVTPEIVQQLEALLADTSAARDEVVSAVGDGDFLYHNKNVVGAVSQSNGVPAGAIIQRGSNVNGEFTRFVDGTVLAKTRFFSSDAYTVISETGWFYPENPVVWTFPVDFSVASEVNLQATLSRTNKDVLGGVNIFTGPTITQATFTPYVSTDGAGSRTLHVSAAGSWY